MRECVGRHQVSVWPPSNDERHALLCHRQFIQEVQREHLVSVPLYDSTGDLQGVLLVASDRVLSARKQCWLKNIATPIANSVRLLTRAQPSWVQRLTDKLGQFWQQGKIRAVAAGLGVLACLALIPMPYQVTAVCEVQPSHKRFVAAPFKGSLQECYVEPGDRVMQDQVLARMDEREIKLELAEVEADLHRAETTVDGHVALHESGQARVARFEAERLRARQQLLVHRSQHLQLRSSVNGVVISGDLKRAEGMPLETGQALFEIAPLKELVMELSIPEDEVRYVEAGMQVRLQLDAFPFETWQGTIERVHPAAELRDDENVFVATVSMTNESGELLPGMRGNARIQTVWRPVGWNLLHQPLARAARWLGW